jgi:hypothetical protein
MDYSVYNDSYKEYYAPMKTANGLTNQTRTKRRTTRKFRNNNATSEANKKNESLFTRTDLINLINKSIYFLYTLKKDSLNKYNKNTKYNINVRTGKSKRRYLFDLNPLYEHLITNLPIISKVKRNNYKFSIIKFNYDDVYQCNSSRHCIDDDAIDLIEIRCSVVKGVDVAYILYEGKRMSVIAKEPLFMNRLTEKEAAFMKLIFDNANVLTEDGFSFNKFQAENISEQLNIIVNKNRNPRLVFSNKVQIKEIPNIKTMKRMRWFNN